MLKEINRERGAKTYRKNQYCVGIYTIRKKARAVGRCGSANERNIAILHCALFMKYFFQRALVTLKVYDILKPLILANYVAEYIGGEG